ncbi:MAG TPA: FAD-dependent oxidoreductase [Steroidobacteraceae bacterium]|nr:FAD-dependent oxidoreductase [Steroidobacteraceae bacterium]
MSQSRRALLETAGSLLLLPLLPHRRPANAAASTSVQRVRPSDAAWPSEAAWQRLKDAVGGKLLPVHFPLDALKAAPDSPAARALMKALKNPYWIADEPGLTETLGWVDAWVTRPSVYAVAARNARDIAAAVNFARENRLRLVVKGRGHSYLGASNAPDSLMIWTRHMTDVEMHSAFVPRGCQGKVAPQPAVTIGAGTHWMKAYQAVTTQGGRYVQGGGCTTVGVAGLTLGGGFGSFSKRYGTAAASLLEAEVVTADGELRIANACMNPDLLWALKGGGGGTFGVVSKLTVRTHDLPEYFGGANFDIKAPSDEAYRSLLRAFVRFYAEHLFNEHWGEQVKVRRENVLEIRMVSQGLNREQLQRIWQPFVEWVKTSPNGYSIPWPGPIISSLPARRMWDAEWQEENWPKEGNNAKGNPFYAIMDDILVHVMHQPVFDLDERPGAAPSDVWWGGDSGQVGWYIWAYESLWMPAALLASDSQLRLADTLFAGSRHADIELHFNKGLAGAPPGAIAAAKDTAMNPTVLTAFALAIVADGEQPAYPGIPGHEPDVIKGRAAAKAIDQCVEQLRAVAGPSGSYVNETNYFQKGWQRAFWGDNYSRLAEIKQQYDPAGLFFVHNGVGSESWSRDGFTRL